MITIFSLPKEFTSKIALIQTNAIGSWLKTQPGADIILLGKETGLSQVAAKYHITHWPEVAVNEYGTPLLNSAFSLVQDKAKNNILVYVNSDVMFINDLVPVIEKVVNKFPTYLVIGRRWDITLERKLDFTAGWETSLKKEISTKGKQHGFSGIDYFIFPKKVCWPLPQFAVGRQGWDNWLIWYAKANNIPVIDATALITAVHQNHDFKHSKYGEKDRVGGPETRKNYALAGGFAKMLSIREADWVLNKNGLEKPPIIRQLYIFLARFQLWQFFLSVKRKIQSL